MTNWRSVSSALFATIFSLPLTCGAASAAASFRQVTVATDKGARFIATADLNHDGKTDLLVANAEGGSMTVLLGDGKGAFAATPASPIPAGHLPNDIAITDLNGDGTADFVIANHQSPYLRTFLGDGKGGFRPAPGSPFDAHSKPHPHGVSAAEFFGPSGIGVVTDSWASNQIELLQVNDKGRLLTPGRFFAVGRRPYERLRVGDFNKDGHPDVVTTNLDDDTVTILLGDGKGGLGQSPGSPFPAGGRPWQIAIDDLNGDDNADLAVIPYQRDLEDPKQNQVTILLGDGKGGFTHTSSSSLSLQGCDGPCAVATGDIDGDGRRDVVVACAQSRSIAIFYSRGEGRYERVLLPSRGGWGGIAAADLNSDKKDDLVAANPDQGTITLYLSK